MKFSDFPPNTEVKIKPIQLDFWFNQILEIKEIKSIVYLGEYQGYYCFDNFKTLSNSPSFKTGTKK